MNLSLGGESQIVVEELAELDKHVGNPKRKMFCSFFMNLGNFALIPNVGSCGKKMRLKVLRRSHNNNNSNSNSNSSNSSSSSNNNNNKPQQTTKVY